MTLNKKFRSVKTLIDVNRESPLMNENRAAARGSWLAVNYSQMRLNSFTFDWTKFKICR